MKKEKKKHSKEIQLPTEEIQKMLANSYYEKSINQLNNSAVTINHLENIFTNETYYLAMKIVPLLERKVLYLSYVENIRIDDICRRLKLPKKEIVKLRNSGINHFKHNLEFLYKTNSLKNGGKNNGYY